MALESTFVKIFSIYNNFIDSNSIKHILWKINWGLNIKFQETGFGYIWWFLEKKNRLRFTSNYSLKF